MTDVVIANAVSDASRRSLTASSVTVFSVHDVGGGLVDFRLTSMHDCRDSVMTALVMTIMELTTSMHVCRDFRS